MQIIVLGMHRSGTSSVARLLNLSGAYFGPPSIATPTTRENPKGFWERRDIRALCDDILHAMDIDWWCPSSIDFGRIDPQQRDELLSRAEALFRTELAPHEPYFVKEPRLCLLFPFLRPIFDTPVVVNVVREPLQVARSLRARNGFPIPMGLALWEFYQTSALLETRDLPVITACYGDIIAAPVEQAQRLCSEISALGLGALEPPPAKEIEEFIDVDLYRSRTSPLEAVEHLTERQRRLWERNEIESPVGIPDALRETLASCEEHHWQIVKHRASIGDERRRRSGLERELAQTRIRVRHAREESRDLRASLQRTRQRLDAAMREVDQHRKAKAEARLRFPRLEGNPWARAMAGVARGADHVNRLTRHFRRS